MKIVAIVTMIIGCLLMLLIAVSCGSVLVGIHNGICQQEPATQGCSNP